MSGYGAMSSHSCHCTCKSHDLDHVVLLDVVAEDLLLFMCEMNLRLPSRNTQNDDLMEFGINNIFNSSPFILQALRWVHSYEEIKVVILLPLL